MHVWLILTLFHIELGLLLANPGPQGASCSALRDEGHSLGFTVSGKGSDVNFCKAENNWCIASSEGKPSAYLDDRYIVRFTSYKYLEEQREELVGVLGPESNGWRWIKRSNKAASHPTDFGLISLGKELLDHLQGAVAEIPGIRDVHPDSKISQGLKWKLPSEGPMHGICSEDGSVQKKPGRLLTRPTIGIFPELECEKHESLRKLLFVEKAKSFADVLQADKIWNLNYTGNNVKMGVFDTGVRKDHPHIKNIKERTNWTHEPTQADGLGHGSFVAGVIASSFDGCLGLAPDVDLFTFRVFTNDQVSYTSWFLDAFNYALITKMDVVNLSIGGPDYLDEPFVDKVKEVTSNGILMVSAIGNDGPLYGTLNNPADQNDVIGVGGINYSNKLAHFSSRGMSSQELPLGYGRIKPDIVTFAQDVRGSRIQTGCRSLSGTSVASPVVAGAVCMLVSTVPEEERWNLINPASMKQALVEGATRIDERNIYEQGNGALNLENSMKILKDYKPRASLIPQVIDLTDCPYMWPFCTQPLYANAMPVMLNATIMNGMGVTGKITTLPKFEPIGESGSLVEMDFDYSDNLWPWSGFLACYITVKPKGADYKGLVEGNIIFTVTSPPARGERVERTSTVKVPFKANVIPVPPRAKRILWDQFHSIKYPPAYIPRDNLDIKNDILDWHGDHPHTNYHKMFNYLRENGYYLEVLGSPYTCFDASQYGTLLIVDPEDEFYSQEITKLQSDVSDHGLGLVVFADWYNVESIKKMKFFDDNTRSWWMPVTGGSNVPALNDLLKSFGIAFGDTILQGQVDILRSSIKYSSGVNVVKFPAGGHIHAYNLKRRYGDEYKSGMRHEVLGLTPAGEGKITVYGDCNCLDASFQVDDCFGLLQAFIEYVTNNPEPSKILPALLDSSSKLQKDFSPEGVKLPERPTYVNFTAASFTLQNPLQCYKNSGHDLPSSLAEELESVDGQVLSVRKVKPHGEFAGLENETQGVTPAIVHTRKNDGDENQEAEQGNDPEETITTDRVTVEPEIAIKSNTDDSSERIIGLQQGESGFKLKPPVSFSKWSALIGILITVGLYRFARRKRDNKEALKQTV